MTRRAPIATYNITGIADGIASIGEKRLGRPNTTLVFGIDWNGMVSLKEAFLKIRYEYQEEVEVPQPKNVLKSAEQGADAKKEASEDAPAKQAEPEKEAQSSSDADSDAASASASASASDADVEAEAEMEKTLPDETLNEAAKEPAGETVGEAANETAAESSGEKQPKKGVALVTKRKIRKIPLRVTSVLDRLVVLPMTDAERQRSMDL